MLIRGRISLRDDEPRLIPDTIQRLHEVREQHAERLILKLTPDMLDDEQYRRLNGTLQKYSGERRVAIKAFPNTDVEVCIHLPTTLRFTPDLAEELEELLPVDKMEYTYPKSAGQLKKTAAE